MNKHSKSYQFQTYFEKRRCMALQQRKLNRQAIFQKTRKIFIQSPIEEHFNESQVQDQVDSLKRQMEQNSITEEKQELKSQKKHKNYYKNKRNKTNIRIFAQIFQVSDWLNIIPKQFSKFYITAKPDGLKCIIFFKNNIAIVRDKLGKIVKQIRLKTKHFQNTILEGYYKKQQKFIDVSDIIAWKGNLMTGSEFIFRYSWLISNLISKNLSDYFDLRSMDYRLNTPQNLEYFYDAKLKYQKDGLIFVHPQSFYEHGLNPNNIVWKDFKISKNPICLNQKGEMEKYITAVLKLQDNGNIYTQDKICVGEIDQKLQIKKKGFIKISFQKIELQYVDDQIKVYMQNMNVINFSPFYRSYSDPLSKLVYQFKMRYNPLKIEQLFQSLIKIQEY